MTETIKSGMTKKKNVIPVKTGIHSNIFYVLISIVFATLIVLVPTFLALAANVPTNVRIDRATISNTGMTIAWTNSGSLVGNRIWRNGYIVSSAFVTTATNVTSSFSGLSPGVNYVFKIGAYDAGGYTDWSFAAAGITKSSTGAFVAPHANFVDNSNMCSACHSIHKSRTRFKLLYSRYSELTSQYTGAEPGVDLCFNCHDGTGASSNTKGQYQGAADAAGHKVKTTASLSLTATGNKGWKMPPTTQTTSVGQQLPCMVCHDAHVSSRGNWRMLADDLYRYSISTSAGSYDGEWRTGTTLPWEQVTSATNRVDEPGVGSETWQAELCTVCHHGSKTDNEMIVKGIDLYWNTSHGASNTDCKSCHTGPHNLSKGAGYPTSQADSCGCHESVDDPYLTQMDAGTNTSLHYVNKAASNNDPPASNSCVWKCHNNHGGRNPTRAFNVWVDQSARVASADYDFTASATAPGLCLSCHQTRQPTGGTTSRPGGQTSNSSGYVQTIAVSSFISSAHSYRSESYRVGGYDSGAPTTGTGTKQFAFRASCLKCHRSSNQVPTSDKGGKYGPHASANRSLLVYPTASSVAGLPGSNAGDEEQTCFWCHSPSKDQWGQAGGQRAMATVAWRISQAFAQSAPTQGHRMLLMSTTIDRHRAGEGTQPFWMTAGYRHVECQDCHNPHAASQGYNYWASLPYTRSANELETPTQGVISKALQGVWGVYPTTNWSSIPTASIYSTAYNMPSTTSVGRLFYTASASKQVYICLKCHSSYAYGTNINDRPNLPSGVPGSGTFVNAPDESRLAPGRQTDILSDLNPNNAAHHAVFTIGKFQPVSTANSQWTSNSLRLNAIYGAIGADHTYVPPFGTRSMLTCSDCHSSQSTSYSRGYYTSAATIVNAWDFPRGPHGSSRRWILRKLDRSIRYQRADGSFYNYSSVTEDPSGSVLTDRIICINCHRADVYWNGGALAPATDLARVDHIPNPQGNHVTGQPNIFGNVCRNCHGGTRVGGIHGMGGTTPGQGAKTLGPRLIGGAIWNGYAIATSSITCYMYGTSVAPISSCGRTTDNAAPANVINYAY